MHGVTAPMMWPKRAPLPHLTATSFFKRVCSANLINPDEINVPLVFRVKELTVDHNQVMEGGRVNIHAVNQLDFLDEDWQNSSPQRDDLKLLCEQNVSSLLALPNQGNMRV